MSEAVRTPPDTPVSAGRGAVPGIGAWLVRLVLFAVAVHAGQQSIRLVRVIRTEPGLPLWDEAAQSLVGAQLLDALRALRPLEFFRLLNDQVVWPFVHGLVLVPWMAVMGDGWESAAQLNARLAVLTPILVFAGATRLHPTRGLWAGAIAAALLLGAPLYGVFGTLGMLEMPGAFLLALTFALHAFAGDREARGADGVWSRAAHRPSLPAQGSLQMPRSAVHGSARVRASRDETPSAPRASRSWWIAAGVSTTALVLLKYNYGLLWIGGLLLFEWLDRPARVRSAGLEAVRSWLARGAWLRPMPIALALYALALVAILVTGGGVLTLFGQRISVRSPGNPAYGFLLLATGWALASWLRHRDVWGERWRALPERTRIRLVTIGLPLLVWFLIPVPNRVRALVEFSINRASGPAPWSLEGLSYYPEAFARDFSAAPWLGWVVLALALIPPRRLEPPAARLAWCAAIVGLVATVAHRYHDPRFLFTTVVVIALSAAGRLVGLLATVAARLPSRAATALWTVAMIAALAAPILLVPSEERVRAGHRAFRGPQELEAPIDFVLRRATATPARAVLLGISNPVSPALLEWRARERGAPPRDRVPRRARPGELTVSPAEMRAIVIPPGQPVFALLPHPGSPLDSATRLELEGDRRAFEDLASRPDLEATADTTFEPSQVRVVELRSRIARR